MKPPIPDGNDRTCIEEGCHLPDRISYINLRSAGPKEGETWPAGRTGDRLGVVAPARRVGILLSQAEQTGNASMDVRSRS